MKTLSEKSLTLNNPINQVLCEAHLNDLARKFSFTKRLKKLSGANFFFSLLSVVRSAPAESLLDICIALFEHFSIDISRQGIDQRFNEQSVVFMKQVLEELLLTIRNHEAEIPPLERFFKDIQVLDSTRLSHEPSVKMQLEYRILSGQLTYLMAEPANTQDHRHCEASLEPVEEGILYLRDRGYYKIAALRKIAEGGAYFLCRKPAETILYVKGKKQKTSALIKEMMCSRVASLDMNVELSEQRLPVRLIIRRVSPEQAQARLHHAKRQSKSHHYQMKEETYWACFADVLVTNASKEQLKAKESVVLYGFREQIEVLFKALKSFLRVFCFKKVRDYRMQTILYVKLIAVCISMDKIQTQKTKLWIEQSFELSELKAFKILGAHLWGEFLNSLWSFNPRFYHKLQEMFIKYAVKQEPKGRRVPFADIFSSMEMYNFSGP